MDVPSMCTIVKTIEWVGPAYGHGLIRGLGLMVH